MALPGAVVLTATCVGTSRIVKHIGRKAALVGTHFLIGWGVFLPLFTRPRPESSRSWLRFAGDRGCGDMVCHSASSRKSPCRPRRESAPRRQARLRKPATRSAVHWALPCWARWRHRSFGCPALMWRKTLSETLHHPGITEATAIIAFHATAAVAEYNRWYLGVLGNALGHQQLSRDRCRSSSGHQLACVEVAVGGVMDSYSKRPV